MIITEQLNFYTTTLSLFFPLIIIFSIYILNKRKKQLIINNNSNNVTCETIIDEWTPEPLVSNVNSEDITNKYIIDNKTGYKITINNKQCINFATHNYYSFIENNDIIEDSIKCIQKYGVGSCGPRGFFGTIDVHLDLEENISNFMKAEESVLYSYGFSTIASAIFAYIKRNDVVFVDENINFAIQTGLIASRCNVKYFKHNDMKHLEELLEEQNKKDEKKIIKKFIIIEGIYIKSGNICKLNEIINLRYKYKCRLFVDESLSIGVLGQHGRGVTDYFNISVEEIDLIIGSLEYALGSVGGFCVGSSFVIEHHRLSGAGYCFSASLAPFSAVSANTSLNKLKDNPLLLKELKTNCQMMHEILSQSEISEYFILEGHKDTPLKNLYLKKSLENEEKERKFLESFVKFCIESGFAIMIPSYLNEEFKKPRPSIRITCNIKHTREDMENLQHILCKAYFILINQQ